MSNVDCSNDGTAIIWSMSTKTSITTVFNGTYAYPNDTNVQIKIKDQKQNITNIITL